MGEILMKNSEKIRIGQRKHFSQNLLASQNNIPLSLLRLSELVFRELPAEVDPSPRPVLMVRSDRSGSGMFTVIGLWNLRRRGSRVTIGETAPPCTRISSTMSSSIRVAEMPMAVSRVSDL